MLLPNPRLNSNHVFGAFILGRFGLGFSELVCSLKLICKIKLIYKQSCVGKSCIVVLGGVRRNYVILFLKKYMSEFPNTIIETIVCSEIDKIIEYLVNSSSNMFYRGQSNSKWKLVPKIDRLFKNQTLFDTWERKEFFMLEEFKKYSIPFKEKEPKSDIEWLVLAQHYGLPTRLLDWSTNPLKALYFAVEDLIDKKDGILYALQLHRLLSSIYPDEDHKVFDRLTPFYPSIVDVRVIAQEGCFTLFPFPQGEKRFKPIEHPIYHKDTIHKIIKIIIPKNAKRKLKTHLDVLGVNRRTLFPDLEGISSYIS